MIYFDMLAFLCIVSLGVLTYPDFDLFIYDVSDMIQLKKVALCKLVVYSVERAIISGNFASLMMADNVTVIM